MMKSALAGALALAAVTHFAPAHAQGYPARPVRMIVPFPAAGATDILARVVSQKLSENFKQQVVVDNRAGAGGTLGSRLAADAQPDGYPILMGTTSTGIDIVHIPYKGTALVYPDMFSGQIAILFDVPPVALPFIKAGRV